MAVWPLPTSVANNQDSLGNGLPDWFRNYITTWFGPGNDDPWANPSGDNVPNIVKYEIGLDPTIPDYWNYLLPPPGDESQQFVSLQINAPYSASTGPNNTTDGYFPVIGANAGLLGTGFLYTASDSGSGAGVANLDLEIWPLDLTYNYYVPFSANPGSGEFQEPDVSAEFYRELVLEAPDLAHDIWTEIKEPVLESLSSKTLEYLQATSVMKVELECRRLQTLQAVYGIEYSQPGALMRAERSESIIEMEITKEVSIDLEYAKHYPDLDWVGKMLGIAGRLAVAVSLVEDALNVYDKYQGYHQDVQNHVDQAGPAHFSESLQQALVDFISTTHIPFQEALDIELDPTYPIFDPIPLGLYDGGQ